MEEIYIMDLRNSYEVTIPRNFDGTSIPHFIIREKDTNALMRVRFDSPFTLPNKEGEDELEVNEATMEDFLLELTSPFEKDPTKSIWQVMLSTWNAYHPDTAIAENMPIPDYRAIVTYEYLDVAPKGYLSCMLESGYQGIVKVSDITAVGTLHDCIAIQGTLHNCIAIHLKCGSVVHTTTPYAVIISHLF